MATANSTRVASRKASIDPSQIPPASSLFAMEGAALQLEQALAIVRLVAYNGTTPIDAYQYMNALGAAEDLICRALSVVEKAIEKDLD